MAVADHMNTHTELQGLTEAAFARVLAVGERARFFKSVVSDFREPGQQLSFDDLLVPQSKAESDGSRSSRVMKVAERNDGKGLDLVWQPGSPNGHMSLEWAALANLPPLPGAVEFEETFARLMATQVWEVATRAFETAIQNGLVTLLARIGSPFVDPTPVTKAAMPHLTITDWDLGTGLSAGIPLFDLAVVREFDEEAAYRAKVKAAPFSTNRLEIITKKLYPAEVPPKEILSNTDYMNALAAELKALGLPIPDNKTLLRSRPRKP